ncbi:TPA: hypothetical protein MD163_004952 [Klebsiella aerogenes]|nr:hypothetical protein [Klebsiella aerogenes]
MDYFSNIDEALSASTSNYQKLISRALGEAEANEDEAKDKAMNHALMVEGFRPIVTPDKQIQWVPKPKMPTQKIANHQKIVSSMSPEQLQTSYPFLQYAIKHFIPAVEDLVTKVQNQDISLQFFQEQMLALMKGGTDEAIKNTGGNSAQGKGSISKSTSPESTAAIILKEKNTYKQLVSESDYAKAGYTNIKGGK